MGGAHLSRSGLVTLCLVSALHCGAPAPELSRGLSERTLARLAQARPVYAPAATGGAVTADTAALAAAFEGALEPQARVRIRHDPALDLVAAALAENFSDQGRHTSSPLAQWLLWRSGSVALYQTHSGGFVSTRTRASAPASLARWTTQAAEYLNAAPGSMMSYGLSRFTAGRVTAETFVVGLAPFEVATFLKTYAPGGPLTLSLKPRVPIRELRFSMDTGDAVEEETLAPRPDGSFFLSRAVPSKPGRYFIEIQGPPPQRATMMTVPLYVGVPEPTTPDAFIQHPPPGPVDLAGWPAWLASTYDAERARFGKPPLQIDEQLTALATERSLIFSTDRRAEPTDSSAFSRRLTAFGFSPADFAERAITAEATDTVLLRLLRPSVRKRLVLEERVLFGAAAAPRAVKAVENRPPTFSLVEETVAPSIPPPR